MILTVTPNPAWDVTYEVPALVPGELHRVARVHRRLGGKGVNVARVLAALGHDAVAVLPGPGRLPAEAGEPGNGAGRLPAFDVVPGLSAIRQALVVHGDDGVTTSLWEPGAEPVPGTAAALAGRVRAWLSGDAWASGDGRARRPHPDDPADVGEDTPRGVSGIVVSGSLPPGLDTRLHARLAAMALEAGVPAVVDASGEALAHAATGPGVVLAPNASELEQLVGSPCDGLAEAAAAARAVLAGTGMTGTGMRGCGLPDDERGMACVAGRPGGPEAVVVTLGADGLVAVTGNGAWHGCLDRSLAGNPTGAGDAATAALIAGLADSAGWPGIVRDAVALSAAAVLSP
ncbi:MAG: 1-phosphofructokinase, partial [Nocardiopsaceae bacterium]|nr:1-phosphofructokinase [Nocardiopsaceae bacterium]